MNVARRLRGIVAVALFLLAIVPTATAKYSGGSGTAQDPYQIATAADLILLGETPADYAKHFILTADIDLDPNLPGRKVFDKAVLAPDTDQTKDWFQGTAFAGIFDGNGHRISHLTIKGGSCLGLFGALGSGAEVKDLAVVNVNITSSGYGAGGLVGENWGSVTCCYSTGVTGGAENVGGLVGFNAGDIGYCYSMSVVSGEKNVGGLVGHNGIYTSIKFEVSPSTVIQCYSTGLVTGTGPSVGGLVGSQGYGHAIACFWDTQTSGQVTSNGGIGKTAGEMQDPKTFMAAGWDFVGQLDGPHDIWAHPESGGYPVLWWQQSPLPELPFSGGTGEPDAPYLISTPNDLISIGHNPRLMKCHFRLVDDLEAIGFRFYPIGDDSLNSYRGVFDGNGHTISHLTVQGEYYVGLFGRLASGAEVRNLGIVDVNIAGSGGCIGSVAGINAGTVTRCYSTGAVTGNWRVGGLVGYNDSGDVTQCYSTGAVSGSADIGGLVGCNYFGDVTQCYSTSAVTGPWPFDSSVGGLVGDNDAGTVIGSFWDIETSGQTKSAGGTGKTTTEMQTAKTFLDAGWDFVGETANGTADLWWILEGKDYPRLWWELGKPAKATEK
jgi:hypothetical protein